MVKFLRKTAAAAAVAMLPWTVAAQPIPTPGAPVQLQLNQQPVSPNNPLPTAPAAGSPGTSAGTPGYVQDSNSAEFDDMVPITPGTPFTKGRSIAFWCTAAGSITVTMATNGRIVTFPILASASLQTLPLGITNVTLGSGTASAFWNLP